MPAAGRVFRIGLRLYGKLPYNLGMAKTHSLETARVEFRMPAELKQEVEEAAALVGATFTSFATEILVERARQVKREHAQTVLSDTERDAFLDMLSKTTVPSDSLVKLMQTQVQL